MRFYENQNNTSATELWQEGPNRMGPFVLEAFITRGYALVPLSLSQIELLQNLSHEARTFLRNKTTEELLPYAHTDRIVGFREAGAVHAGDINKPDRNHTLLYRPTLEDHIPRRDAIESLVVAQRDYYFGVGTFIMNAVLEELAERYNDPRRLQYHRSSMLQLNWFNDSTIKPGEEQQGPHEDRVFITVSWMSDDGFECMAKFGEFRRPMFVTPGLENLIVMPSSVLTAMTAGAIPPLEHRVIKLRGAHPEEIRMSFVSFFTLDVPTDGRIDPYVGDLAIRQAIESAADFGTGAFHAGSTER